MRESLDAKCSWESRLILTVILATISDLPVNFKCSVEINGLCDKHLMVETFLNFYTIVNLFVLTNTLLTSIDILRVYNDTHVVYLYFKCEVFAIIIDKYMYQNVSTESILTF